MKTIKKSLLSVIVALMLASCLFEYKPDLINMGEFSVLQNNVPWGGHYDGSKKTIYGEYFPATSSCAERYIISFALYDKEHTLIEIFSFRITHLSTEPTGNKTLTILNNDQRWCETVQRVYGNFYTTYDHDAIIDIYRIQETGNNYLIIDSFDQEKFEIKGAFQATFVINSRSEGFTLLPDTVRFTNGTFQTRIEK